MMEQYREVKKQHPQDLLMFRLGDFYELFFDDAELAARELEITLTSREAGNNNRVPMCGVPYHAVDSYLARLIAKGYRVAICEQMEDPRQAKGIVKREVVRVVTPGTILSESVLAERGNNYLALVWEEGAELALAAADISTGEFLWALFGGADRYPALLNQLSRLFPAELVVAGKLERWDEMERFLETRLSGCTVTNFVNETTDAWRELPAKHFPTAELPAETVAFTAVARLLQYLHQTLKTDLSHVNRLTRFRMQDALMLDATTLRNLEITRNMREGSKRGSLLGVLDYTATAMGGRLLRQWLETPLVNLLEIRRRHDAVEELLGVPAVRQVVRERLKSVYDLERILTRIEVGSANARDLAALRSSFEILPELKQILRELKTTALAEIGLGMATHADCAEMIGAAIVDSPPFSVREGGFIRDGYDLELDELRSLSRDSRQWVQDLETREKESTGIKSLKISYNKVFGYYIEVTHANTTAVPANYVRKQTLVNAERYITPELKEFETKILGAQEKIVNIEYHLFCTVRDFIKKQLPEIQATARHLAVLDCLLSFAEAAANHRYIRPEMTEDQRIVIRDGRHPVVERLLSGEIFVPNDTFLDPAECEVMILTGPNMAGKSTYMRQVALLTLMAQAGSFIPAKEASISPVDRIFTRVGASDDLATGQSTFMLEMNEVSQILKHATSRSLIILDEIGRGTSTFDGMSIARAVVEYVKEKIRAKTIFATHYHELTCLAEWRPGIRNYSMAVKERGNDVMFLRRVVAGGADKSYGIHVAKLAGLPGKVVERAQELLVQIELESPCAPAAPTGKAVEPEPTLSLFRSTLADEVMAIDVMTLTPLEALNVLHKLNLQAKQEAGKL
jgi:DNA mismatch repair protein MutS